jgi:hypothetical protein
MPNDAERTADKSSKVDDCESCGRGSMETAELLREIVRLRDENETLRAARQRAVDAMRGVAAVGSIDTITGDLVLDGIHALMGWRTALKSLPFTDLGDEPQSYVDHIAQWIADLAYGTHNGGENV